MSVTKCQSQILVTKFNHKTFIHKNKVTKFQSQNFSPKILVTQIQLKKFSYMILVTEFLSQILVTKFQSHNFYKNFQSQNLKHNFLVKKMLVTKYNLKKNVSHKILVTKSQSQSCLVTSVTSVTSVTIVTTVTTVPQISRKVVFNYLLILLRSLFHKGSRTNGQTDGRTDGPTDQQLQFQSCSGPLKS